MTKMKGIKRRIFVLAVLVFGSMNSFAQEPVLDSLTFALKNLQPACDVPCLGDSQRVNTLVALGWAQMQNGSPEMTEISAREALKLSRQIRFRKGEGNAQNLLGLAFSSTGDYPSALKHQFIAIEIYREIDFQRGIAGAYNNTGRIYMSLGNYEEAIKNFYQALRVNEKIGNKSWISINYTNLGSLYILLGNQEEALKNFQRALEIQEALKDSVSLAGSRLNIGSIYVKQQKYDDAFRNFDFAARIFQDLDYKTGIASAHTSKAIAYYYQGNYKAALKHYQAALQIAESHGNKETLALYNTNLGDNYVKLKNYPEARHYLGQGLAIALEIGNLETIKDSYASLAQLDSATGNWKAAFYHEKLFNLYRDSLDNESNRESSFREKMTYDFEKKEAVARAAQDKKDAVLKQELQQQKLVRNSFIGGFAVVLLFAGVFFRQRNKIAKGKKRSDELLLNILPVDVANELKQTGSSEAKQYNHVTVLFTDFVNFTGISQLLSPAELVQEIHKNFTVFDNIMEKHGLEKIKTIGDAYLAVAGLPHETADHAQRIVKAALDIQQHIHQNGGRFQIRIGIHSGPVVAGIVGVKKFAYDIWGDTVNTAARMEQSSEAGKINISETTFQLVKDDFNCVHRGKINAKNKGEIDMYFVEGGRL